MDRLISEKELLKHFDSREDWVVVQTIKAIPSADLDLKQSFKDGYDTALNDVEDRIEALLNNNPWYANAISDILQIINEQKGSD